MKQLVKGAPDWHVDVNNNFDELSSQMAEMAVNVKSFGAKGDGITDDTEAFNLAFSTGKNVVIPETANSYRLYKFQGVSGQKVIGIGKPRIDLYNKVGVSVVPLLGFADNSEYENLYFNCLETDLEWNRGELASKKNVLIKNCKIQGFRNPTQQNSWGLYLDESENITIEDCEFIDNTQADIAIVEGCKNITIINPKGPVNHLNFEPNVATGIKNVKVIGGTYNKISLLENDFTKYAISNTSFDSCTIENLLYNGASCCFKNCIISKVSSGSSNIFAGTVDFGGSIRFSKSLIKDTTLRDITNASTTSAWKVGYSPHNQMIKRINDIKKGDIIRLNPNGNTSTIISLEHNEKISADENKEYGVVLTSSALYPIGSNWIGRNVRISYLNELSATISSEYLHFNRAAIPNESPFNTEVCIIKPPTNTKFIKVAICLTDTGTTTSAILDISNISLHEITYGNVPDNIGLINLKNLDTNKALIYSPQIPTALNAGETVSNKGEIIYNSNPVAGGYIGWICVTSGNPGIWKGFGLIEA